MNESSYKIGKTAGSIADKSGFFKDLNLHVRFFFAGSGCRAQAGSGPSYNNQFLCHVEPPIFNSLLHICQ